MSPSRRAALPWAAICLAVLAAAWLPSLAGWQDDYKEGRQALEDGRHNKAETLLRAAIARKDKERANAIKASGMFFEPYLPHFYLGLTLFQKQEYEEAIRELDTSESMGVVTKDPALMAQLTQTRKIAAQLAEASSAAKEKPPAPAPPPAAREEPPGDSSPAAGGETAPETAPPSKGSSKSGGGGTPSRPVTQAEPLEPPPTPAPAGPDPALIRARDAAAGDIAAALKLKTDAGGDLSSKEKDSLDGAVKAIREAATPGEAASAHESLKKLTSDTSRAVDQRRTRRAAQELESARQEAGPALSAGKKLLADSGPEMRNSEKGRLSREISALEQASSPEAVRQAARTLGGDVESLRRTLAQRAAAPPPADDGKARAEALARARQTYAGAVEAYFTGDYDRAVAALESAGDEIEDDPEIHALMGSALYKQYILTRSRDEALRTRAEEAFRHALKIKPDLTLDAGFYPPKVVAFFRQVASGSSGQ